MKKRRSLFDTKTTSMASKALPALDDLTSSLKSVSLSSSPSSSSTGGVLLIDSLKKCSEAMGALIDRAEPVAVDFEGIALSREGRLCLAQVVSADDSEPVYLVDVVALGADAFGVGRLGELLSSETLVKLVFDCRSDREALRHQFGVALNQVYDIQVVYCMRCDEVADTGSGGCGCARRSETVPGWTRKRGENSRRRRTPARRCSSRRTANRATLGRGDRYRPSS